MFEEAAKIAIGASDVIFLTRKAQIWPDARNLLSHIGRVYTTKASC